MILQENTPSAERDQSQLFYSQNREHKNAFNTIQNQTTESDFMQFDYNSRKSHNNLMSIQQHIQKLEEKLLLKEQFFRLKK